MAQKFDMRALAELQRRNVQNEQLESEVGSLEEQIRELEKKNEGWKARKKELEARLREAADESRANQEKVENLEGRLRAFANSWRLLDEELDGPWVKRRDGEEDYDNLRTEMREKIASIQRELDGMWNALEDICWALSSEEHRG